MMIDVPARVNLLPRQAATSIPDGYVSQDGRLVAWWNSKTAVIVKWSLFWGLLTLVVLVLSLSFCHAKKRMKKGLPPLAYHRWMVHRQDLSRVDTRYAYPQATYTAYSGNNHEMKQMAPPPPMYDPNAARPPIYQPPEDATKVDPAQSQQAAVDSAPPPGAPRTGT